MTATVPRRRPPTLGGLPVVRPRSVYGVQIFDPSDGSTRIDYVGKTIRDVHVRLAEHRGFGRNPGDEQPWSDLVVGVVVLESDAGLAVPWSDAYLAERERVWIRNAEGQLPHAPRYNWADGGETNPLHIPKWVAAEQRAQRDRARGLTTRWTNPDLFTTPVLPRPVPSRSVLRRLGTSRPVRWLGRHVAPWVVVWLALWVAGMVWGGWTARDAAGVACVGLAAAVGGWRKLTQPKRRRGRRTNRRRNR